MSSSWRTNQKTTLANQETKGESGEKEAAASTFTLLTMNEKLNKHGVSVTGENGKVKYESSLEILYLQKLEEKGQIIQEVV